jgi:V8-like Glu-specific endopeptidase
MYDNHVTSRSARHALSVASVLALLSALSDTANAQQGLAPGVTAPAMQATGASVTAFWTADRLLSARPIEVHPSESFAPQSLSAQSGPTSQEARVGWPARPPTVSVDAKANNFVHPPVSLDEIPSNEEVAPAFSMQHGLFTESRVIPPSGGQDAPAVNGFPYRAAGALFAHDPRLNENLICSASMISARLILTAGHCVQHGSPDPNQAYFFDNFLFIPGYNNGNAPYGKWSWSFAQSTADWANNGNVPNAHDFALIEAADNGNDVVGKIVGSLGWTTGGLSSNHFTTLGYPCNLDNCMLMQRNDAQTSEVGGNNTWIQGTSMRGGASGGPWVQDFGVQPAGAPGVPAGGNLVVGVSSYGPTATDIGYLGASQFDSVFVDLLGTVCAHKAGNC